MLQNRGNQIISFSVAGFTAAGPAGATYTFTNLKVSVTKASDTSLTHTKSICMGRGGRRRSHDLDADDPGGAEQLDEPRGHEVGGLHQGDRNGGSL